MKVSVASLTLVSEKSIHVKKILGLNKLISCGLNRLYAICQHITMQHGACINTYRVRLAAGDSAEMHPVVDVFYVLLGSQISSHIRPKAYLKLP